MFKMFQFILIGSICATQAFAADLSEKIAAGSRAQASAEKVKIQQERLAQNEQVASTNPSAKSSTTLSSPQASIGSIHFTGHNGAFHNPMTVSYLGESVELEDGSIWSIAPGDTYNTLNWLTSDLLVITPNHEWFTSYDFRITNQNTGVSVACNLSLIPVYNGLYTHWITAINYYTQEIALEDGSIWQISGWDSSTFNQWLVNDTLIIGVNDGFLSGSKENILINPATLTWVRAHCVF